MASDLPVHPSHHAHPVSTACHLHQCVQRRWGLLTRRHYASRLTELLLHRRGTLCILIHTGINTTDLWSSDEVPLHTLTVHGCKADAAALHAGGPYLSWPIHRIAAASQQLYQRWYKLTVDRWRPHVITLPMVHGHLAVAVTLLRWLYVTVALSWYIALLVVTSLPWHSCNYRRVSSSSQHK